MNNKKYDNLLIEKLKGFRRKGENLEIVNQYVAEPSQRLKCELCGWPDTSSRSNQLGLKYVYELQNVATGEKLNVGKECITNYQQYICETEPNFEVINISMIQSNKSPNDPHDVMDSEDLIYLDENHDSSNEEEDIDVIYNYYFGDDEYVNAK